MMDPTFTVGVTHAAHIPERVRSLGSLMAQLSMASLLPNVIESRPGKFWEWSRRCWLRCAKAARQDRTSHIMIFTDDVVLHPDFGTLIRAAVASRPADVINLHLPHWRFEDAPRLEHGGVWASSDDGLVGPGYVIPVPVFLDFLRFTVEDLHPEAEEVWPDDSKIATYCLATRRKILHPVPAIMNVDDSLVSCYGHDGDVYTQPWVLAKPGTTWDWSTEPYHIGLCYEIYHWSLITHLTPDARRKFRSIERAYELERTASNPRYKYVRAQTTTSIAGTENHTDPSATDRETGTGTGP